MNQETYLQQLVRYIRRNVAKGYTLESLKWALIDQGYSRSEVNKAVKIMNEELAKEAPKMVEKPVINVQTELMPEVEPNSFWKSIKDFLFG